MISLERLLLESLGLMCFFCLPEITIFWKPLEVGEVLKIQSVMMLSHQEGKFMATCFFFRITPKNLI